MTPGDSQFTLNMLLGTASTGTTSSRTWKIRIAQIPCGTSYTGRTLFLKPIAFAASNGFVQLTILLLSLAPDNCLQWFTTSVGTFSSFNYQFSSTPAVRHLANQDYTICIRMSQVKLNWTRHEHPHSFEWLSVYRDFVAFATKFVMLQQPLLHQRIQVLAFRLQLW